MFWTPHPISITGCLFPANERASGFGKKKIFAFQTFPNLSWALWLRQLRSFRRPFAGLSCAFAKAGNPPHPNHRLRLHRWSMHREVKIGESWRKCGRARRVHAHGHSGRRDNIASGNRPLPRHTRLCAYSTRERLYHGAEQSQPRRRDLIAGGCEFLREAPRVTGPFTGYHVAAVAVGLFGTLCFSGGNAGSLLQGLEFGADVQTVASEDGLPRCHAVTLSRCHARTAPPADNIEPN